MEQAPQEITVTVVEMAADALEMPIDDLPPLSDVVDLDALDALVTPTTTDPSSDLIVTFQYAGLHVTIQPGEFVYAQPIHDDGEDPADSPLFDE